MLTFLSDILNFFKEKYLGTPTKAFFCKFLLSCMNQIELPFQIIEENMYPEIY